MTGTCKIALNKNHAMQWKCGMKGARDGAPQRERNGKEEKSE